MGAYRLKPGWASLLPPRHSFQPFWQQSGVFLDTDSISASERILFHLATNPWQGMWGEWDQTDAHLSFLEYEFYWLMKQPILLICPLKLGRRLQKGKEGLHLSCHGKRILSQNHALAPVMSRRRKVSDCIQELCTWSYVCGCNGNPSKSTLSRANWNFWELRLIHLQAHRSSHANAWKNDPSMEFALMYVSSTHFTLFLRSEMMASKLWLYASPLAKNPWGATLYL